MSRSDRYGGRALRDPDIEAYERMHIRAQRIDSMLVEILDLHAPYTKREGLFHSQHFTVTCQGCYPPADCTDAKKWPCATVKIVLRRDSEWRTANSHVA